jgi:hypothetical protein
MRVPFDVERARAKHARDRFDPGWAERPTFIEDDGTIVLQGHPLFRCKCGKQHITGTWVNYYPPACPACGEPYPRGTFEVYRSVSPPPSDG